MLLFIVTLDSKMLRVFQRFSQVVCFSRLRCRKFIPFPAFGKSFNWCTNASTCLSFEIWACACSDLKLHWNLYRKVPCWVMIFLRFVQAPLSVAFFPAIRTDHKLPLLADAMFLVCLIWFEITALCFAMTVLFLQYRVRDSKRIYIWTMQTQSLVQQT